MSRSNARPVHSAEPYGSSLSRSFTSGSPLAEALIAKDLAQYEEDEGDADHDNDDDDDDGDDDEEESSASTAVPQPRTNAYSLTGSYRRPSYFTTVSRATVLPRPPEQERLFGRERDEAIEQERNLLADNNVIPPENAGSVKHKISGILSRKPPSAPGQQQQPPTETTSLLGNDNETPSIHNAQAIDLKWDEAVREGLIRTTWQREAQVVGMYALPLMFAFVLQYSLTVASIFTLGHLGKEELGAVSLASMTANITGYAVYQGLATSLDTLCAQAYGSGKKQLVGLQMQRMVYFLWTITIPIALFWIFAEDILVIIVPETRVARLAGRYLKIVAVGAPGYALFESAKRYVMAQGLFWAALYVLVVCAPLNAFMNWLFVWVSLRLHYY